jgi:small multidrug resistance pump
MSTNDKPSAEFDRSTKIARWILSLAGIYNLLWGAFVVLFPLVPFRWINLPEPNYPELWQCIGMIVGVYGIGYLCAAVDPWRHWPITLVGFLGKIFGPIGFIDAAIRGRFPWTAGWTIVTNDLIWWLPFGWILWQAWQRRDTNFTVAKKD